VIRIFNMKTFTIYHLPFTIKKGFTLLEALVAIAILMMAIGSAFALAPQGLTGSRFARNQTTATYLAQEGLEVVHNMRDNAMFFAPNTADPLNWLAYVSACIDKLCTVNAIEEKLEVCGGSCPPLLSIQTPEGGVAYGNGPLFSTDPTVQTTIFTRSVTLHKILNRTIGPTRDDTEASVIVRVTWKEGNLTKVTEVKETLFDWWTFTK